MRNERFAFNETVHEMSMRSYAVLISLLTATEIAIGAGGAALTYNIKANWILLIAGFVGALIGIGLAHSGIRPLQLIGASMISFCMGAITGPYAAHYTGASVANIFALTCFITVGLGFVGAVYPKSLASWGGFLLTGLWILIAMQFGSIVFAFFGLPMLGVFKALDIVGVIIFSAFVIYDMNQAMREDFTFDNALEASINMFLNFANIFIKLLSLLGDED